MEHAARIRNDQVGRVLIGCGMVSIVAVFFPPTNYSYTSTQTSIYDWSSQMQAVILVAAAAWVWRHLDHRGLAAVVGIIAAAQLTGTGIVAHRRWYTSGGFGSHASNEPLLRLLALMMASAGAIAVGLLSWILWVDGALRFRGWIRAVTAVAIGVTVAAVVPLQMRYEPFNRTTQLGAHALMHSLPWALVIAVSGWLDWRAALAGLAALFVCALPLVGDVTMIPAQQAGNGFVIVAIACLVNAAIQPTMTRTSDPSR
jgi:hypothetical protein